VEVRVLGPLEVSKREEPAALPGAKPRQLLALLALRPNQPVPAEVLIDELWDETPPSTAASALRVHLTRVRRLLESADSPAESPAEARGAAPRLSLDAAGYVLRLAPDELDVTRFEQLVARGKEAVSVGDLHDGQRSLRSALSLWRGPALADVRDLSAAKAAVARLEQLRLGAIEELAEARVILGDAAVADWLVEVVAEYPLHEGLVGQLMRSLDRSGRAADALRAYRRLQRDLDEQLGVSPSAELRKLEEDILLQRAGRQGDRHGGTTRVELRGAAARRFVGRRTEMERLLDLDHAAAGLLLVEGEAGVGKTALVDEYCRRARALDDVTILTGRCVDGEVDEYHAVKALLGDAFPHGTDERHAVADYEADHARLLDGIANALGAMRPQRVLLVVEDLHWAGRATLRVLRHVLRHPDLGHVRVLATLRSDETHGALADRITTLCSRTRTVRLALRGLDEFEVRALVRSTAPPDVVPTLSELARDIWAATSGNPFHVRALLQEVDDTGLQTQGTARVRAGIAELAPASVRQLLDRRFARLAPSAVNLVQAASVVGADVSLSTLGSLCDLPAGDLLDAVDQAIDAHILVEDEARVGVVAFEHALLRNSAYLSIPEPDREVIHARVASVYREAGDDRAPRRAAEVAQHLLRSGPRADGELIVEFAQRAGDDAFEELAFDDAARWYERALEHCSPDAAVARPAAELLLALGRAFEADREFARAHDAYVRGASLSGLDDAALRADLVIAASGPWISLSDDPEQSASSASSTCSRRACITSIPPRRPTWPSRHSSGRARWVAMLVWPGRT
jgi:DNA-binding SARP family transcriptional activator